MTDNSPQTLERIARRVPVPGPAYERLLRRRDRRERNRRVSATVLAIGLTLLVSVGLYQAFRGSARPAQPSPTPGGEGIFSGMGGWIAYGDDGEHADIYGGNGVWAMDPDRDVAPVRLSPRSGEPLAWSSDGSKLLILRSYGKGASRGNALYVMHADGSDTLLVDAGAGNSVSGGSFSPDGSEVVYASGPSIGYRSAIYVIDADGGAPTRLLRGHRPSQKYGGFTSEIFEPVWSPDGSQIAYMGSFGDSNNRLRVMNADGSGSRLLVKFHQVPTGSLEWSPDGRRLAFGVGYEPDEIYVVGADGSGLTSVIKHGTYPEWSPDGSRIAYRVGNSVGPLAIAVADGTHVRELGYGTSGPWNPLDRAELATKDTLVTASTTTAAASRLDELAYVLAALAAVGIVVLWFRRRRGADRNV